MKVQPVLSVQGVKKSFGRVQALKGVSFEVYPGEVVGLLGDNGAGKSTLIKLIMGVYRPDEGQIIFRGKDIRFFSPNEIRMLGIEAVPQGGAVIQFMDIARNFFLGREPQKRLFSFLKMLDLKKMKEEATKYIAEVGVQVRSPNERVSWLSGGERQAISIGRTLYFQSSLILLDEPTLNLSVRETDKLLHAVAEMKRRGVAVIFVTHNVYHVYFIGDKFVLLNRGEMLGVYNKEEVTAEELIEMIRTGKPKEAPNKARTNEIKRGET
ncbi:MAG: sugar ABC transporter ATP-binding protein [Methanomassiliicoccales archaeon]|nr:sugar ABC transporter ATP-binding protein [Methanomassiliicoccales archaeon]